MTKTDQNMVKTNREMVKEMVKGMMSTSPFDMATLGDDKPVINKEISGTFGLTEEEKLVIRKARSEKQGRPSKVEKETKPVDERRAIGVQIKTNLYNRLDKALARTGMTKRDFIESLLEREFKKLGV